MKYTLHFIHELTAGSVVDFVSLTVHFCSMCQRSLLYEYSMNWSKFKSENQPVGSDSTVQSYAFAERLLISTWKDGGGLAYIAVGIHYNQLIER